MKIRNSFLSPSPPPGLTGPAGFGGDENLAGQTLGDCLRDLQSRDSAVRGRALGGLMEHARPDDVLVRVPAIQVVEDWPLAEGFVSRRRDLWRRIAGRLARLAEASFDPKLAFPAGERSRKAGRATRDLASAFFEIEQSGKGSALFMVWIAQRRGATLRGAMLHARTEAPGFSFLEMVATLMALDLEPTARLYEDLLDEAGLQRLRHDKEALADQVLDLVLAPLVVRH